MKDLMIDIETMDTKHSAVVLSIGAVFFDTQTKKLGPEFYSTLHIQPQLDLGRTVSGDTLHWWMQQDNRARVSSTQLTPRPNRDTIEDFIEFVTRTASQGALPWGNGSCFDISIIESLLKSYEALVPWKFWNIQDLRTFNRFIAGGEKHKPPTDAHNALADAKAQAFHVIDMVARHNRDAQ